MARSPLTLRILSPEGIIMEADQLESVQVPLVDGGSIGIRPGHAPLIAEMSRGDIVYKKYGQEHRIALHPGVLDIHKNLVILLTAGQSGERAAQPASPETDEFERLIQTLGEKIHPENDQNEASAND